MVPLPARKRLPLLLAAVLAAALPAAAPLPPPPADGATPALVVRRWLALDPVDIRGRVPFNPNAPLLRYLLDRASPPPREGEAVKGDLGEAKWRPVGATEDGTVEDGSGAWFYGEVEGPKGPGGAAGSVHLARLDGASTLFVNGAGFPGDVYRLKTGPVPVALLPGTNRVFVAGPRGPWSLRFEAWAADRSPLLREDATLPDLVEGDGNAPFAGAVSFRVANASTAWRAVGASVEPAPPPPDGIPMPPLWTGKDSGEVSFPRGAGAKGPVRFGVRGWPGAADAPSETFELPLRAPGEARRIAFVSRIDDSVQFYGYLPPAPSDLPPGRIGLVLSLHGAGVDALDQARSYAPKKDFRIVAPTNRRPYGFDWQDWGRRDAYEALADAARRFLAPPGRLYLTGHSMGGHGTWHLAALDPGAWAAIAPSAGWCSFDTYGGPRPTTPLTPIWRACDGGSRTEDLVADLAPLPTFVLHGTMDGTVPLSEAEGMLRRLGAAGGKPLHHFQEGADHWWDADPAPGASCVDWPGIFDLFRRVPPASRAPGTPVADRGPFKSAFDNRFVLVVGTKGTEEENREAMELARFHAATWWYRANGSAPVVRDGDLAARPEEFAGRNLILYGNPDGNAAWAKVVPDSCPVKVRRGSIALGDRAWKGDGLGAVFVHRRADGPGLVGAFASTGPRGTRAVYGLLPFLSGVGYPDYAVFGEGYLRTGDGGVLAAGWFDRTWALQPGGHLAEDGK